jgi:hypothetical protein
MEDTPFKSELRNMELRLDDLEQKIDMINTKVTQVVDAILGNPLTKVGGLMQDIDTMKNKISELERKQVEIEDFKKRVYWTVGIVIAAAAIVQYITNVYVNIKK